jgi:hypothetical protein
MDKQRAIDELIYWQKKPTDTEIAHGMADEILCDFLIGLGYGDIVEEYKKIDKWYD